MRTEKVDKKTGLISEEKFNVVKQIITKRPNGTIRVQQDYSNCPSMAEQHTAHLTDLNYLVEKYKPDELAAYIVARSQHRQEILGHDFSNEPSFQEARNIAYNIKKSFDDLSDDVKMHFKNHLEFVKFIDNPANAEKMLKLGLMTQTEITNNTNPPATPPTKETKEPKGSNKKESSES